MDYDQLRQKVHDDALAAEQEEAKKKAEAEAPAPAPAEYSITDSHKGYGGNLAPKDDLVPKD